MAIVRSRSSKMTRSPEYFTSSAASVNERRPAPARSESAAAARAVSAAAVARAVSAGATASVSPAAAAAAAVSGPAPAGGSGAKRYVPAALPSTRTRRTWRSRKWTMMVSPVTSFVASSVSTSSGV